jgi:hypothetical protein
MFTKISENEFNSSDPLFRLIVHDHPRAFGSLRLPRVAYALTLCWRSDQVDPVIRPNPFSAAIWVGVDQHIACVSPQGNVLLSLGLGTPLLQIKHFRACTIALCEAQAVVFNKDYSLRGVEDLRTIPETVDLEDGKMIFTLIDGSKEAVAI